MYMYMFPSPLQETDVTMLNATAIIAHGAVHTWKTFTLHLIEDLL